MSLPENASSTIHSMVIGGASDEAGKDQRQATPLGQQATKISTQTHGAHNPQN
jgi:hypothetical protein